MESYECESPEMQEEKDRYKKIKWVFTQILRLNSF